MRDAAKRLKIGKLRVGTLLLACSVVPLAFTAGVLAQLSSGVRSIDGTGNNQRNPHWGSAQRTLLRKLSTSYNDGVGEPAGADRPSARAISNAVAAQEHSIPNLLRASDFVWQWGQFLDHDISLTAVVDPEEHFDIPVPLGDPFFDPFETGSQVIPLNRSFYDVVGGIRQQVNEITSYIDASNVYGSDEARAMELRTLDGTGRLKTSPGDLLPFNVGGFPNAPTSEDPSFFLAGDFRANEQVGLTSMHVLFVREHNFWAGVLGAIFPSFTGEDIYQLARMIIAAEMQVITFNEFLPVLLGPNALDPYAGYDPGVNAGIANVFSTAAYRFGHSMLSSLLLRLDQKGQVIAEGHLPLRSAFFSPTQLIHNGGIEPLLRGLASQTAQNIDGLVVDDVRNMLFGPPGSGGFDLASLNIQRGRDHGLPSYNEVRLELGLDPAESFEDINPDPAVFGNLADVYNTVDDVDLWVGGLVEPHVPGALVGEVFFVILKDQFQRLRDGDRFWYQLEPFLRGWVERQTLGIIVRRNTSIDTEMQDNVFLVRSEAQRALHFAQFGSGPGVTSRLTLTNPSQTESATGKIRFFDDAGQPVAVNLVPVTAGQGPGASTATLPPGFSPGVVFAIPPLTTQTFATEGQEDLVVCSAVVKADNPLKGLVQFSIEGVGSTELEDSTPLEGLIVPVRRSEGTTTGIALHNVEEGPITLSLTLRDTSNQSVPHGVRTLTDFPPSAHLAQLIEQLFPEADTTEFLGSLLVKASSGRVAATALELSAASGQLTSLTVTPLE